MRTLVCKLATFVQLIAVIRSELDVIWAPATAINGPLVWEPIPPSGYYVIGQYVSRYAEPRYFNEKIANPDLRIPVASRLREEGDELAEPLGFEKKIDYNNQLQLWSMLCPNNYVSLSGIATIKLMDGSERRPDINRYRCVNKRITQTVHIFFSFYGNEKYGIWTQPVDGNSIGSYYVLAERRNDTASVVGHQLTLTPGYYTASATALGKSFSSSSEGTGIPEASGAILPTTTLNQMTESTSALTQRKSKIEETSATSFYATTHDETIQTDLKLSINSTLPVTGMSETKATNFTQVFGIANKANATTYIVTTIIAKTRNSSTVAQSTKENTNFELTTKTHAIISIVCGIVLAILLVVIFFVVCRKFGFCTIKKSKNVAMGALGSSSLSTEVAEFVYQETTEPSDGISKSSSQQRKREMRFNVLYEQTTPGEFHRHSHQDSTYPNSAKNSIYSPS